MEVGIVIFDGTNPFFDDKFYELKLQGRVIINFADNFFLPSFKKCFQDFAALFLVDLNYFFQLFDEFFLKRLTFWQFPPQKREYFASQFRVFAFQEPMKNFDSVLILGVYRHHQMQDQIPFFVVFLLNIRKE